MQDSRKSEYIYGFHSIESAIQNIPENIDHIIVDSKRNDNRINQLLLLINKANINVRLIDNLDQLVQSNKHQGIVAKLKSQQNLVPKPELKQVLAQLDQLDNAIILILDGITDVHNFGAIIRSADCFGVKAIIIPKNNSASIDNPIINKVSSGAIYNVPIITVNNLSTAIEQLKEHNFWIAGTALSDKAVNLFEFKCDKKIAWVMGNEGSGMRRLIQENCDYLVTIPMHGKTQSLNVSVATGVILSYTRGSNAHK